MQEVIDHGKLDEICLSFNWKSINQDLVELLVIIIENYDKGNSAIFTEIYKPIEGDYFSQEEKNIINSRLKELNNLGLLKSTGQKINNRTVHVSDKLKKIIYTNFPQEVSFYNEFITKLEVTVDSKHFDNLYINGKFVSKKDFKLKNNVEYKIKIVEDRKMIFIEIEEDKIDSENSIKKSGPADN